MRWSWFALVLLLVVSLSAFVTRGIILSRGLQVDEQGRDKSRESPRRTFRSPVDVETALTDSSGNREATGKETLAECPVVRPNELVAETDLPNRPWREEWNEILKRVIEQPENRPPEELAIEFERILGQLTDSFGNPHASFKCIEALRQLLRKNPHWRPNDLVVRRIASLYVLGRTSTPQELDTKDRVRELLCLIGTEASLNSLVALMLQEDELNDRSSICWHISSCVPMHGMRLDAKLQSALLEHYRYQECSTYKAHLLKLLCGLCGEAGRTVLIQEAAREDAPDALGWMATELLDARLPQEKALLLAKIQSPSTSPKIKRIAWRSLFPAMYNAEQKDPAVWELYIAAIGSEPDQEVRHFLLRDLHFSLASCPKSLHASLGAALDSIAESDPNEKFRAAAEALRYSFQRDLKPGEGGW